MKSVVFIGLGVMGLPMASHLLAKGFDVLGSDVASPPRDALASAIMTSMP